MAITTDITPIPPRATRQPKSWASRPVIRRPDIPPMAVPPM
jgi:hypothetical protein